MVSKQLCPLLTLILVVYITHAQSDLRTTIAQCRALCVDEFFVLPLNDRTCRNIPDCFMCWETCEMLHTNFTIWGQMCHVPEICFDGCQKTCDFYYAGQERDNEVSEEREVSWSFDETSFRLVTSLEGPKVLEWSRPRTDNEDHAADGLVYVISALQKGLWREIKQTSELKSVLSPSNLDGATSFRLVAVTEWAGRVAVTSLMVTSSEEGMLGDEPAKHHHKPQHSAPSHKDYNQQLNWKPELEALQQKQQATILATVQWQDLKSDCKYEVSWRVVDYSFEATGRLYTSKNSANITLWPDNLHSIKVKCFDENGAVIKTSRDLQVDTRLMQIEPATTNNCIESWKWPIAMASVSAIAVLLFLSVGCYLLGRLCLNRKDVSKQKRIELQTDDIPV